MPCFEASKPGLCGRRHFRHPDGSLILESLDNRHVRALAAIESVAGQKDREPLGPASRTWAAASNAARACTRTRDGLGTLICLEGGVGKRQGPHIRRGCPQGHTAGLRFGAGALPGHRTTGADPATGSVNRAPSCPRERGRLRAGCRRTIVSGRSRSPAESRCRIADQSRNRSRSGRSVGVLG